MSVQTVSLPGMEAAIPNLPEQVFAPGLSEERRLALASLPSYSASVVLRESFRDPEVTDSGAKVYSELVHLVDSGGRRIVRELTIATPNPNLGADRLSPYPWVETDPWMMDAGGVTRDKIKQYAARGLTVLWLHHGNQNTDIVADKSVSRSAHQMHSTLDDLAATAEFKTDAVLVGGFSRGAMTGEKFVVLADQYGRKVPYSDLEALTSARDMGRLERLVTSVKQTHHETVGATRLAIRLAKERQLVGDRYAGTFNLHPKNLVQELCWAPALMKSDVRRFIPFLPEDATGVRTFFTDDAMCQHDDFQKLYQDFAGIKVSLEAGSHVTGLDPAYIDKKYQRLAGVLDYMATHDLSLSGFTASV